MIKSQPRQPGTDRGQHSFAQVPSANIQRSSFNRSCGLKSAFDEGDLIPIFVDEALPGDTMNLRMTAFTRMATPIYPVMDNMYMDFFFFAVPVRLLWENWERMNGEQDSPDDSTDFLVPLLTVPGGGHLENSLSDYMGIPTQEDIVHTSLWHRAYNLIWNDWFRDQNLQDSAVVDLDDGPDDDADYVIQKRGKRHDYFTSCLPFLQKGPSIQLPLGTSAPVTGDVISDTATDEIPLFIIDGNTDQLQTIAFQDEIEFGQNAGAGGPHAMSWSDPKLTLGAATADLSAATAATINELRESFQIQRMFEKDARGGSRYTEIIRSHFGVVSPDQRLQRPEYLGGGNQTININPVAATTTLDPTAPLGTLGGFGTGASSGSGFVKSFVEHSVIIGLACVRADLNYQQGLDRMFSRRTRFDFFWPALAHLGEQAVLNKEIFADGSAADDEVFGYQERFAEYRYKPSKVTGTMRSNAAASLDAWHLSQDFAALPVLDADFIVEAPPVDRVVGDPADPHFLFDAFFQYKCARPMPVFSVPGLIDHF